MNPSITKNHSDYRGRRWYLRIMTQTGALELIKTSNWEPGYMPIIPHFLLRNLREVYYPVGVKVEN